MPFGRCNGPGTRRLLAPERVGEDALDALREATRERDGVPGTVVFKDTEISIVKSVIERKDYAPRQRPHRPSRLDCHALLAVNF